MDTSFCMYTTLSYRLINPVSSGSGYAFNTKNLYYTGAVAVATRSCHFI